MLFAQVDLESRECLKDHNKSIDSIGCEQEWIRDAKCVKMILVGNPWSFWEESGSVFFVQDKYLITSFLVVHPLIYYEKGQIGIKPLLFFWYGFFVHWIDPPGGPRFHNPSPNCCCGATFWAFKRRSDQCKAHLRQWTESWSRKHRPTMALTQYLKQHKKSPKTKMPCFPYKDDFVVGKSPEWWIVFSWTTIQAGDPQTPSNISHNLSHLLVWWSPNMKASFRLSTWVEVIRNQIEVTYGTPNLFRCSRY